MKISAFHKRRGDTVEFYEPLIGGYDTVYMSKVFDFTPDYAYPIYAREVVQGGTGYGLKNILPPEVETITPDYSLYGAKNIAYGFLTRGCPRSCDFCLVSDKEGRHSRKVADLSQFWSGQREIKLLDPNLLACPDHEYLLAQLAESRAWVDFTQGLDIRLTDERINELITRCRIKMLHFAWDCEKDSGVIVQKLKEFKAQTGMDFRKLRVYVLVNFNTYYAFDLERVYRLRDLGFDPYIMIYDKQSAPRNLRQLQRWVNNKFIFRQCERIEDYNTKV